MSSLKRWSKSRSSLTPGTDKTCRVILGTWTPRSDSLTRRWWRSKWLSTIRNTKTCSMALLLSSRTKTTWLSNSLIREITATKTEEPPWTLGKMVLIWSCRVFRTRMWKTHRLRHHSRQRRSTCSRTWGTRMPITSYLKRKILKSWSFQLPWATRMTLSKEGILN